MSIISDKETEARGQHQIFFPVLDHYDLGEPNKIFSESQFPHHQMSTTFPLSTVKDPLNPGHRLETQWLDSHVKIQLRTSKPCLDYRPFTSTIMKLDVILCFV